jgi:hypothetical protein
VKCLYDEIIEAEHVAQGCQAWEEAIPKRIKRLLRLKRKLQKEGIWDSPGQAGKSKSAAVVMQQLTAVKTAFRQSIRSRKRDAIYFYLEAVFGLVTGWLREGSARWNARRCLRLHGKAPAKHPDPFAAVIWCTSKLGQADRRTVSKLSRALNYAKWACKNEALTSFIKRHHGINACAARGSSRRQGRK